MIDGPIYFDAIYVTFFTTDDGIPFSAVDPVNRKNEEEHILRPMRLYGAPPSIESNPDSLLIACSLDYVVKVEGNRKDDFLAAITKDLLAPWSGCTISVELVMEGLWKMPLVDADDFLKLTNTAFGWPFR